MRAAYRPSDVRLLDRHGEVIDELRVDAHRRRLQWTPLRAVSPAIVEAIITAEDRRFRRHSGVDVIAMAGAFAGWITGARLRGASTITMQLAALLDPRLQPTRGGRSLGQKWQQMRAAWQLERRWSKDQILEAYLNLVSFRGELQGVGTAAGVLFDKVPDGVTNAEALVLAALLKAPNAESIAVRQRAAALSRAGAGSAAEGEIDTAVARAFAVARGAGPRPSLAPHVARRLLSAGTRESVASTLDAPLQRYARGALHRHLLAVRDRSVQDGAVLVADNASGEVLAYVGGSGALSSAPYVDGVRAHRQPGSALKPFLYGLALEKRLLTAASLLEDAPLAMDAGAGIYEPQNYDEQFHGLVSARTALAGSLNIPAVRTLSLVGGGAFVRQLRRLGFAGVSRPADYYGPALALGAAEVSLWEMAGAYRALANGGLWTPLHLRAGGATAEVERRVYSPATAFIISDILSDRESRMVTFGLENSLATRFWAAVKTGTSKDMRDNWCVGYSRRYTVAVWVGNFSGAPMRDVSGITGAAPVWLDIMTWLHRDTPSAPPLPPPEASAQNVRISGGAETPRREWFIRGTEPRAAEQRLAPARPRIRAPTDGAVIAIDPDIPEERQRLAFDASGVDSSWRWQLDGEDIGSAAQLRLWSPRAGHHALALADAGKQIAARVRFTVRGPGK